MITVAESTRGMAQGWEGPDGARRREKKKLGRSL